MCVCVCGLGAGAVQTSIIAVIFYKGKPDVTAEVRNAASQCYDDDTRRSPRVPSLPFILFLKLYFFFLPSAGLRVRVLCVCIDLVPS